MTENAVVMRVARPGAVLTPESVEITPPDRGWVRVSVSASGVCHADIATAAASPSSSFPVTPGHEVAGVIAELGHGVEGWALGDRVSIGWFGGSCGYCEYCRVGDVVHCAQRKIPGVSYPGGWAESITVPVDALARIPDGLDFFDAAPMGCAGVTTFNAIRRAHVPPGGTVAVFGIGGLGHLAIQFAAKMGYRTIAIARGHQRSDLARQLGAHHYIDSITQDPGHALKGLGGADLIVSTASTTAPIAELIHGLRTHGQLTLIGVDAGTVNLPAAQLVMNANTVTGHLTGSARDTEETMQFAVTTGIRPMIERMPLDHADEAVRRISAGTPRFRIVLGTTAHQ